MTIDSGYNFTSIDLENLEYEEITDDNLGCVPQICASGKEIEIPKSWAELNWTDYLQKDYDEKLQTKFSDYMQNISRSKSFGRFVLIV